MNKDELIPLVRIQIKFKASILEGGNIKWKYAKKDVKDVKLKLAIIRVLRWTKLLSLTSHYLKAASCK